MFTLPKKNTVAACSIPLAEARHPSGLYLSLLTGFKRWQMLNTGAS